MALGRRASGVGCRAMSINAATLEEETAPERAQQQVAVVSNATVERVRTPGAALNYMSTLSSSAYERLRKWALFRQPNYWYIFLNGLQILTCIVVLVYGFVCVQEARDDLKANVAFKLMDKPTVVTVNPCGYPAPDMLHLLRLQGVYENSLGMPQLIEPDYNDWNTRVQGGMCATDPYWTFVGNDKNTDDENDEKAQLLHGLAAIMQNRRLEPTDATDADHLLDVEKMMLNDMCNTQANRSYSKRLETAFGDPLTRIARAYLAAAPAFRAYRKSQLDATDSSSCLGNNDPFGYGEDGRSRCGNADYINTVLQRAGSIHNSARLAGIAENEQDGHDGNIWHSATQFVSGPLEMLYALYALSVINHYDKTLNDGMCFNNKEAGNTLAFCEDLYPDANDFNDYANHLPEYTTIQTNWGSNVLDVNYYREGDYAISYGSTSYSCLNPKTSGIILESSLAVTSPSPPAPPPFRSYRGAKASEFATQYSGSNDVRTATAVKNHVIGSCAATMQYGLYDQERLFGLPDVLQPFQHDNRPDASLHFLGKWLADEYFLGPLNKVDAFMRPVERLELYLAYRLASLSLWGSLVAVITGYFIGRSGVPFGAAIIAVALGTKNPRGRSSTIVQPESRSIYQDFFTIITSLVALFVAYYTIFVDPSAQSYYPATPVCDDFVPYKAVHSSGGAYVTSWGKRRFNRYSEAVIGIVLIAMVIVPLFYSATKVFVTTRTKLKKSKRTGTSIRDTGITFVFWGCALTIIGAQAANCINSGNRWLKEAINAPYDTTLQNDRLSRDCLAVVLVSFWNGLAFAVNRASWVIREFSSRIYHIAFFGGCMFTVSLSLISYLALLPDEFKDSSPLSVNPPADGHRYRAQWVILAALGAYGVAVFIEFWSMQKEMFPGSDASSAQEAALDGAKTSVEAVTSGGTMAPVPGASGMFFNSATVHVDPRALTGAALEPPRTRAAAATVLSRLPLSSEQRRAPIGTRSRGLYAPMTTDTTPTIGTSMPHLNLRH